MAQAKRKRRTGAKIATKREQTELVQHAHRLADDPTPLVPVTNGAAPLFVVRLRRRLARIARLKGKPRRLRWYVRFGPKLTRAYANLLLVADSGKASRMASMKTPVGELKYAVRGTNLGPRHQVAVQHFRHPEARIPGYREVALKTGNVVWATPTGVELRKRDDAPPEPWFDLLTERVPLSLLRRNNALLCPHLAETDDPHHRSAPTGLELTISTGPLRVLVCNGCIAVHFGHDKTGLLAHIGRLAIGFHPKRDISVRPTGTPRTCVHDGACSWTRHLPELGDKTLERYLGGAMPEADLLERLQPRWDEAVRNADERLIATGPYCHGDDEAGLLDALGLTGDLRDAMQGFLDAGPRVILTKERTTNQILEACWDQAPRILAHLHPDPDTLRELLERHKRSPPLAALEEVLEARRAAVAMKGFPVYPPLPEPAMVADGLARANRVGGAPQIVAVVDQELKRGAHKGVLWAALRITGATQGREWQFSRNDQEAGEFLETPLRGLLEATSDTYHASLGDLHTLAGGAGNLPAPKARAQTR